MITLNQKVFNRFISKIDKSPITGCWLWKDTPDTYGYGQFFIKEKCYKAHRVAYELFREEIPVNLHLDHLCRVRNCVNPDHLEPVTNKENILRGFQSRAGLLKHCQRGHELTSENFYYRPSDPKHRECKACKLANDREYQRKRWRRLHPIAS